MSEHVVAVRATWESGIATGVERDADATRALNEAIAQSRATSASSSSAVKDLTETYLRLGDGAKEATVRLNEERTATAGLGEQFQKLAQTVREATSATSSHAAATAESKSSSQDLAGVLGDIKSSVIEVIAAFEGFQLVKELIKGALEEGVKFNALEETSRLGQAGLISTFAQIYDSQGRLLTGRESYNEALRIGTQLQGLEKERVLETTLQYSQLLDIVQRALPYMLQAFRGKDGMAAPQAKMVDFAATFGQAAVSAGLGAEEVPINIQRFLAGTADPRHARFAAQLLGTIGPTPAEAKQQMADWEKQGVLLDKVTEKLAAFKQVSHDSLDTYAGAMSNAKDKLEQLLGEGTTELTRTLTHALNELGDSLFTVDVNGKRAFAPGLVDAIKTVSGAVGGSVIALAAVIEKLELVIELAHEAANIKAGNSPTGDFKTPDQIADEKQQLADLQARQRSQPKPWFGWSTSSSDWLNKGQNALAHATLFEDLPSEIAQLKAQIAADQAALAPHTQQGKSTAAQFMSQVAGGAKLSGFADPATEGQELLDLAQKDTPMYLAALRQIKAAAADGTLTQIEYVRALKAANKEISDAYIKPHAPGGDGGGGESKVDSFKTWLEQLHIEANPSGDDALSRELDKIEIARKAAIAKFDKGAKDEDIAKAGIDWKQAMGDLQTGFDNKRADAIEKDMNAFTDKVVNWGEKFKAKTTDSADPVAEAIAKITSEREAALNSLEDLKRKYPDPGEWNAKGITPEGVASTINSFFDQREVDAYDAATKKANAKTLAEDAKMAADRQQIEIESQDATEKARIALITDSIDQQLATQLEANQKAADEAIKTTTERLTKEGLENSNLLTQETDLIKATWKKRDEIALASAKAQRDAQIVGTKEWLSDLERRVNQTFPKIGLDIQDALVADLQAVRSETEKTFASIVDGGFNLSSTLTSIYKDLGHNWSKVLADMLSNSLLHGQSIVKQWQEIQKEFNTGNTIDSALAGAGMGAFIGGAIGGPNTKAGEGGAIGGALGAIIGSWIPVIGTLLGAEIGSVLGSLIGSMMPTGSDHINVNYHGLTLADLLTVPTTGRIVDGKQESGNYYPSGAFVDVSEKGISEEARADLLVQVTRKAKETMKGYQTILDLFPAEIQAELAKLHPTLDLTGGTGDAKDITDAGALGSLSDFLGNKLPKAAFAAYKDSITQALSLMGENAGEIQNLMTYWGTLQGSELQTAVQTYVTALVQFQDIRTKLKDPESALADARKHANTTNLSALVDINTQIDTIVTKLPKALDVTDQLASMQQLNTLGAQFYQTLETALQNVDAKEKQVNDSIGSSIEQVQLAGMSDQQKMDYYYSRMAGLREQLRGESDPDKAAAIVQQIENYANAALGLAPGNQQNRDNLIAILNDVKNLAGVDFNAARNDIYREQKEAAASLADAAKKLLEAAEHLAPPPKAGNPDIPPGGKPGGHPKIVNNTVDTPGPTTDGPTTESDAAALERVMALIDRYRSDLAAANDKTTTRFEQAVSDVMADVEAKLSAITFRIEVTGDGQKFLDSMGIQLVMTAIGGTINAIRADPDIIIRRAD